MIDKQVEVPSKEANQRMILFMTIVVLNSLFTTVLLFLINYINNRLCLFIDVSLYSWIE